MKNQRQLFKPKQSLLQKDKPLQFFLVNLKKNRNFAKSTDMNHKKYNYDEPVEANIASEPAMAYNYVNQGTYGSMPEPATHTGDDWETQELKRREQIFLEPDDEFRSAITIDELKERMHVSIRKFFADKK